MWPHAPGGPDPITTGTLPHLAAGGRLAPEAEGTLASLARDHQYFHWHLEFPGVFRLPGYGEAAPGQARREPGRRRAAPGLGSPRRNRVIGL